jgi:hypothetical protein
MIPDRAATPVTRMEMAVAIALSAAAGAMLLALRVLDQTGDSLAYAWAAKTGRELFHPHHILFSPVTHLLHVALVRTGVLSDTILAMQLHNVAWGCAGLTGMYLLGRDAGWSRVTAALASGLLLAANGYLEYATQGEVYVPATACLVFLVLRLLHHTRGALTVPGIAELCLWWLLAIGYHQTNVLFVVPLAAFAWAQRDRRSMGPYAVIVGCTGLLCLSGYVFAYLTQEGPHHVTGFVRYTLNYALQNAPDWGNKSNVGPLGIARQLKGQLSVIVSLPPGRSLMLAGTIAAFGVGLAVLLASAWRLARRRTEARPLTVLALAWLVTYYAFFLWWLPGEKEFYIATLVPLLLLLGVFVEKSPAGSRLAMRQATLALVAIAVLVHGLRSTVLPEHRTLGDTYARALDIATADGRSRAIATGNPEIQALRYYFDIESASELLLPLERTLATGRVPDSPLRPAGRSLLLDLKDLRPDRLTEPNGFDHPREWFRFTRWLLEASPADSAGGFTALVVERDPATAHSSIVSVPGTAQRYASWESLFARLDSLDTRGTGSGRRIFSKWAAANRSVLR